MTLIVLYVTFDSMDEARNIAGLLLTENLIACANFFDMKSMYKWKGKVMDENEVLAIIKTTEENHKAVENRIKELHSYDIPCIVKINADANHEYSNWVVDECEN